MDFTQLFLLDVVVRAHETCQQSAVFWFVLDFWRLFEKSNKKARLAKGRGGPFGWREQNGFHLNHNLMLVSWQVANWKFMTFFFDFLTCPWLPTSTGASSAAKEVPQSLSALGQWKKYRTVEGCYRFLLRANANPLLRHKPHKTIGRAILPWIFGWACVCCGVIR